MVSAFPASLHHFTVQALLGTGQIASVYRAINRSTGQEVALKVLRADSPLPEAYDYFQNEGMIVAQIKHPNIPTYYGYVPADPPCLAVNIIEGKDAETLLRDVPTGSFLPTKRVLQWAIQIGDALSHLHSHQPPIVVRDLKPSHIMVDAKNHPWLVDFNLARIMPEGKVLTNADAAGTPGFAPPELYRGVISPLVDVYALGATLHYLLTGIDPRQERRFTFAPPRSINPGVPRPVAQMIMKALAYEPEERFQEMEELCVALRYALIQS